MAAISPADSHSGSGTGSQEHHLNYTAYGSTESVNGPRSPRHVNLGFLKNLTERKTREGQTPKRRGPKPDSKPALTRRQELNRQAQRTHRERKEVYIKALEEEVMRTKEMFSRNIQEKNAIADENRKLKELLQIHGISFQSLLPPDHFISKGTSTYGGSSFSNGSGSHAQNSSHSPATTAASGLNSPMLVEPADVKADWNGVPRMAQLQEGLDHDQIGIDFVLTLEQACNDHQQFMCVRSQNQPTPEISGHALMASCPPRSHILNHPDVDYPHKTWDIPDPDLMKLFNLSQNLPLDGEITPIMALQIVRSHGRFGELSLADFDVLKDNLKGKSRCYGFGAVLEEFEVRDALSSIFATKVIESFAVAPKMEFSSSSSTNHTAFERFASPQRMEPQPQRMEISQNNNHNNYAASFERRSPKMDIQNNGGNYTAFETFHSPPHSEPQNNNHHPPVERFAPPKMENNNNYTAFEFF